VVQAKEIFKNQQKSEFFITSDKFISITRSYFAPSSAVKSSV